MGSEFDDRRCEEGVILGVDGGTTSTVCVCLPFLPVSDIGQLPDPLPILGRAAGGCSNYNSVGENAARETLEQVIAEALTSAGTSHSLVRAVCLGISGVNHQLDQERIFSWMRPIFSPNVKIYVQNDAVAALASGTMGKLHGCVLIAGTGCIAYGFTEDGREARAAGAGPVLGDWGSGYGIAAKGLTAVVKAHDGRGPATMLTNYILQSLSLSSPDEIIGFLPALSNLHLCREQVYGDSTLVIRWTYADSSWARIAALVPVVVSCAEAGDQVAEEILSYAVEELVLSVKAVVQRLQLAGKDGKGSFPIVIVGGVLEANRRWDVGREVTNSIVDAYPGACPVRPKVEPAVGAALFAWNSVAVETNSTGHR